MRKIYLSLAACLLSSATCFGQVLFGVQGSGQLSTIGLSLPAGTPDADAVTSILGSKMGFRAGLMADIPVSDRLSVRPQVLYATKGFKMDFGSLLGGLGGLLGDDLSFSGSFNYVEVPIQAMYGLDAGPGRVVVGAGPYLGYLLSANSTAAGQTEAADLAVFNRLDYGANVSVGYELPMGLSVSAYYSHGFATINKAVQGGTGGVDLENPSGIFGSGNITNRSFGLTLGYFFGTGN